MTKTLLSFKDYGFIRQVVLHVLQMFFLVVGTLAHASKQNEVLTYGLDLLAMDRRLCLKNCLINGNREMDRFGLSLFLNPQNRSFYFGYFPQNRSFFSVSWQKTINLRIFRKTMKNSFPSWKGAIYDLFLI